MRMTVQRFGYSVACSGRWSGAGVSPFASFQAWSQASHMKKSKSESIALSVNSLSVSDEWQIGQGKGVSGAEAIPIYKQT
jgi:hypothetical protein